MKTFPYIISLVVFVLVTVASPAAVPSTINYQGRITDAAGVPLAGSRVMSIKVYDSLTSGALLYSETLGNVPVDANGIYGFQFGANGNGASPAISSTLGGATEHWLEITIDGEAQQPRQKLQAVPFALVAKGLENGAVTSEMIADGGIGLSKIAGLGTAATANAGDFAAAFSAALTGIPTAPTAAPGTNSAQIATTAFVLANSGSLPSGGSLTNLVHAKTYGVTADGATDDTVALQAAINAASAAATSTKRVTVVMPGGIIRLGRSASFGGFANSGTGALDVHKEAIELKSNVNLVGQGIGATVLKPLDASTGNCPVLIAYAGAVNMMLQGFTIDAHGNRDGVIGSSGIGGEDEGINLKGGTNVLISQVEIKNCGQDGLDFDGGDKIVVRDCIITDCKGNGVHSVGGGPTWMIFSGCRFERNGFERNAGDGVGAAIDNIGMRLVATNCIFINNCREINMLGGAMMISGSYMLHGAVAGKVSEAAIEANPTHHSTLVLDNLDIVSEVGHAIRMKTAFADLTLKNSRIRTSGSVGYYCVQIDSSHALHIVGNIFHGVGGGIKINSATGTKNLISANIFTEGQFATGLLIDGVVSGTFSNNKMASGSGNIVLGQTAGAWNFLGNDLHSALSIQFFNGGGDGSVVSGNVGGFPIVMDGSSALTGVTVKNNMLGTVNITNTNATTNTFENNSIGGTISHAGATFASNTWRRNTGAGCAGVFYGTATLASGSVVINTAAANASRKFAFSRQSMNASTGLGQLVLGPVVAQTSFIINSLSPAVTVVPGDVATVFWEILE